MSNNQQSQQGNQNKPKLSQILTAAFQELDINEVFSSAKKGAANSPEALLAKAAAQENEIQRLNEHIDWLLNNKKQLEEQIAELKSAAESKETRPAAPISAALAAWELRQDSLSARNAIVLSEIIAPPTAKRGRDFSKRVKPVPATQTTPTTTL
jgi:predicted  nucleic acid-binding Zn-ribbon protein